MIIETYNSPKSRKSFDFKTFSSKRPLAKIVEETISTYGDEYKHIAITLSTAETKQLKKKLGCIIKEEDSRSIYSHLNNLLPKTTGFTINCAYVILKPIKSMKSKVRLEYYDNPLTIQIERAE